MIAQEVEKVAPELVGTDSMGNKAVKYTSLIGPLIEAVKELSDKADAQEARIKELEEQLEERR